MNAPLALRPTSHPSVLFNEKEMALIRRTCAKDATDDEFNVFMKTALAVGLNPLKKQIFCNIYNKNDAAKRNMVIVTAISGYRTIAERTGNYRPDDREPVVTYLPWKKEREEAAAAVREQSREMKDIRARKAFIDDQMQALDELYPVDPANPEGIEKVTVRVFKFAQGEWHTVEAVAYWSEYAPIREEHEHEHWEDTGDKWPDGKAKRRRVTSGAKVQKLDTSGQWGKMPHGQLTKCCEALALRKAWPDDFSSLYVEEEFDRKKFIELNPSEIADLGVQEERLQKVEARNCLLISWTGAANEQLENVPLGQFADRAFEFIEKNKNDPAVVLSFQHRNRAELNKFWGLHKGDALEIKKRVEALTKITSGASLLMAAEAKDLVTEGAAA